MPPLRLSVRLESHADAVLLPGSQQLTDRLQSFGLEHAVAHEAQRATAACVSQSGGSTNGSRTAASFVCRFRSLVATYTAEPG